MHSLPSHFVRVPYHVARQILTAGTAEMFPKPNPVASPAADLARPSLLTNFLSADAAGGARRRDLLPSANFSHIPPPSLPSSSLPLSVSMYCKAETEIDKEWVGPHVCDVRRGHFVSQHGLSRPSSMIQHRLSRWGRCHICVPTRGKGGGSSRPGTFADSRQ